MKIRLPFLSICVFLTIYFIPANAQILRGHNNAATFLKPISLTKNNSLLKGKSESRSFEENKGQVSGKDANRVKFMLKTDNLSLFLLDNGIAYQFNRVYYPEGYKHLDKFPSSQSLLQGTLREGLA